ncbi:MAG: L-threonylcarbamoyladenylate synthase [Alphaproteobacteria bacterium]|nr:L-threonylcarbamoyladenylate synthase [Alphaproteobacteria bacterium]
MPIHTANADNIKQAAKQIKKGGLVAFPTETVYGLGADARNDKAITAIYQAKARPRFNPLITHIGDLAQAQQYGLFNDMAQHLAQQFWPGALTLIVPRQADCAIGALASAGLPSLALRVPNHPTAQALLAEAGCPLAAPSANVSGRLSPVTAEHVAATLPDIMILDGGQCALGLESTIIGCLDDRPILLRKGAIARQTIELAIGLPLAYLPDTEEAKATQNNKGAHDKEGAARLAHNMEGAQLARDNEGAQLARDNEGAQLAHNMKGAQLAPGRLAQHYAPQAVLRLNATHILAGEALLAFGESVPPPHDPNNKIINLSKTGDLAEAAANFFAALHALDKQADKIAVMPIPNHGLGEAINDRLTRAANAQKVD